MAFDFLGMIEVLAGILIPLIGVILLLAGLFHKKLEKKYRWILAIIGIIITLMHLPLAKNRFADYGRRSTLRFKKGQLAGLFFRFFLGLGFWLF